MGHLVQRGVIAVTIAVMAGLTGAVLLAAPAHASDWIVREDVEVPGTPTSVAAGPSRDRVYVANGRSVLAVDAQTRQVAWTRPVGSAGVALAVPSTGSTIYVGGGKEVVAIDASTGEVIRTIPVKAGVDSLAVSGDGRSLWALANEPKGVGAGLVSVLDPATGATLATIKVGRNPKDIQLSLSGARAYVLGWGSNEVWVLNAKSRQVMDRIPVRSWPEAMALNPAGSRLLVSHSQPGVQSSYPISTINTERRAVVGVFRYIDDLADMALSQDNLTLDQNWLSAGTALFGVADELDALEDEPGLVIIDLKSQQPVATIPVPLACNGLIDGMSLALAPDATRAYITHGCMSGPGALTVVDLGTAP